MKKGTVIGLLLAILSILALGGLAAWLTFFIVPEIRSDQDNASVQVEESSVFIIHADDAHRYEGAQVAEETMDEPEMTNVIEQTEKTAAASGQIRDLKCEDHEDEPQTDASEPLEEAAESEEPSADESAADPFAIWVGDSRTVGMGRAVDNSDIFIGEDGEGYYWLNETGLPLIIEAIAAHPEAPVIFNFGVNDDENIENYLVLYLALEEQYPDTDFYYLAVNPIEPTLCTNISNEEISVFNQNLKANFPDTYIDSFTFVMVSEIITIDGIHYSEDDYRAIYNYAAAQVERMKTE